MDKLEMDIKKIINKIEYCVSEDIKSAIIKNLTEKNILKVAYDNGFREGFNLGLKKNLESNKGDR